MTQSVVHNPQDKAGESLSDDGLIAEYKTRLQNKDFDWLDKHAKQLKAIFHDRIKTVQKALNAIGFRERGTGYDMENDDTTIWVDGFVDFGWWTTYNFEGKAEVENGVQDLLEGTADDIAKKVVNAYLQAVGETAEPTADDEPVVLTGKEFGEFDLTNADDIKAFAQKAYQQLKDLNGEFVFNKSLNARVKLNSTGLDKIRRYDGLDVSPVKLQAVAKLKDIVANAKLFKTNDSYDEGGQKGGLIYYYLKTPFVVDGVEYGARIVVRGDGNGNFYYDFQVKDDVNAILDSLTIKNPLGRDIPYVWEATSNGYGYDSNIEPVSQAFFDDMDDDDDWDEQDENQQSLFDGMAMFDAAKKSKMVLNLFIFDKDGNEIGGDDEPTTLSDDEIEQLSQIPIDDTQDMGQGQRKGVAKNWIKENLLGKTVRTVDGKIVHFNSLDTIGHIPYNVRRNALLVWCVPFIPTIFTQGEFVGRELPEHSRADETIQAFHLYRKWIELKNGWKVNAEVQACERQDEKDLFYAGYNLKALGKKKAVFDGLPYHELHHADAVSCDTTLLPKKTSNPSKTACHNHTTLFDKMQDDIATLPLRILQVLDENGNDITDKILNDEPTKTAQDLAIDEVTKIRTPSANGTIGKIFVVADDKSWWSNGHFMVFENSDNVKTNKQPTIKPAYALDNYKNASNWNAIELSIDSIGESSMGSDLVRLVGQELGDYTGQLHEFGKYANQKYLSFLIKRFGKDVQFFTKSSQDKDPIYIAKNGKMVALLMPVAISMNTQFKATYTVPKDDTPAQETETMTTEPNTKPTAYTQADIDYLNSIINKTIDLETVDMDYIIEIGEKDEHDPLFEQALQVISDYEDEMTKDI